MLPERSNFISTNPRFFDNNFGEFFNYPTKTKGSTLPSVNVKEDNDNFFVEMAAPGLKKGDFSINIENNVLKINGESKDEKESKDSKFFRKEFSYSSFERSFSLEKGMISESDISAIYKDGILTLTLPKRDEAKELPARDIKVG